MKMNHPHIGVRFRIPFGCTIVRRHLRALTLLVGDTPDEKNQNHEEQDGECGRIRPKMRCCTRTDTASCNEGVCAVKSCRKIVGEIHLSAPAIRSFKKR